MSSTSTPQLLKIRDVANRLRVSSSSVYQLVESGRLAHHRIGTGRGLIRISEADLLAFLNQSRHERVEKSSELRTSRPKLRHIRLKPSRS